MALFEDIRFGLRTLAKNPALTLIAVVALALGIGANATVFAIANGVLFKSMPFVDDRILYLSTKNLNRGQRRSGVSWADFRDWRSQAKSFEALGAFKFTVVNLSDKSGLPSRYNVVEITANTFSMIGQKPVMGRDLTAEDEKRSANPVAILGFGIWENRYGKDPAVLGQVIRINDVPTTVIGVMQPGLRFPIDADLWTALRPGANAEKREARNLSAFGRMSPGVTGKQASAEMTAIGNNLESAYPATNQGISAVAHSFSEEFNGPEVNLLLGALMGAVGFVLLIACANVANLLLSRALDRSREISIRIALGAGRWRIIRQLLVESVMLSIAGGVFGWLISIWGLRAFDAAVRDRIPAWMNFAMDYRGFAYLGAISIGTGLLFGLAPALRLCKLDVNTSLKDGGRGSSGGTREKYLSRLLVVTEMALAVVLLAGAGLMIRSFLNVYNMQTGVNPKNVLVMRLFLPEAKYPRADDQISFHERLKARLDALPGVEVSSISITMPTGGAMDFPYELDGAPPVDEKRRPTLSLLIISPDYFRAMEVPARRGRFFTNADGMAGLPVVIVNQRFVEKFWPGDDPIGKRLRIFNGKTPDPWLTVVGVVPNIVQNLQNEGAVREHDPLIYVPYRQRPARDMSIMARTRVPPNSLGTAFRREVAALDEDMPLYNLRSLEERLAQNNWAQRVFGGLFAIFAAIALVLASVGLYAVIAHSVSQRTQEIGLRMALGSPAQGILHLIFMQGMRQVTIGLLVGLAAAAGLTRVLSSLLVQVSPRDPATFVIVSLVLSTAAVLGCLIPACRAMRVDPVVALRHE
jgi:putative ABC transport system permease protein